MTGKRPIDGRVLRPNCPKCGKLKTLENTRTRIVDGARCFNAYCDTCKAVDLRRFRLRNPASKLWSAAKNRARIGGIPFTLKLEDIVIPETCPVFGIPLRWEEGPRTDNTPSLDRHIPDRGYVPDNVSVISWRANRLKNNATPEELRLLADYTDRHTRRIPT